MSSSDFLQKDVLFFIPARGGSKRFPKKNIAELEGVPLLGHVIKNIKSLSNKIRIVVSSDNLAFISLAESFGVEGDHRPEGLAGDNITVAETLKEFLIRTQPKETIIACVYATAALITPEVLGSAIDRFRTSSAKAMMGVSTFNYHPWQAMFADEMGELKPLFPDLHLKSSKEFPKLFGSAGSFYIVRRDSFVRDPNFYSEPLLGYELPSWMAIDVNYPEDIDKLKRAKDSLAK